MKGLGKNVYLCILRTRTEQVKQYLQSIMKEVRNRTTGTGK